LLRTAPACEPSVRRITRHTEETAMTTFLRRVRRSASHLVADSRREFKSIDASRAKYDDGAWLTS
jgi:hypothetical protein